MESAPAIQDSLYVFGSDRYVCPGPRLPTGLERGCLTPIPTPTRSGRPWNQSQWTSVDDRVRGGKSVSQLDVSDPKGCATFRGKLDIRTLGGAGFASQKTLPELFAGGLDLSGYDALVIDAHQPASDDKTYTLILKDTEALPKRPDGRERSTVSWEHDFRLGSGSGGRLAMRFGDFKPTYRGRPKPDAEPLNLRNILAVSIMMRRCVPSVCYSASAEMALEP